MSKKQLDQVSKKQLDQVSKKQLDREGFLMVISATLIVLIETVAIALAGSWALSGLFELEPYLQLGAEVFFVLLAVWLSWSFFRSASKSQPIWKS